MPALKDTFRIVTAHFEGPFDLLLFFIERDELDIYDIPISQITEDFLAYLKEQEELDLDVASEFILVAAKLMRIKAKMLLPRKEKNELGEEIDPREELVARLLEYRQFKDTLEDLKTHEHDRSLIHERGSQSRDLKSIAQKALVDLELESLNLTSLFNTYRRLLLEVKKRESKVVHQIVRYPYTIKSQKQYIYHKFSAKGRVSFEDLFDQVTNRMEAIVTFLSLLELLNLHMVKITVGLQKNSFWITKRVDTFEEE